MAYWAVIVNCWLAMVEEASVTWIVNVCGPAADAVPVMFPEEDSDKPVGRDPEATVQVYGDVPLPALSAQTASPAMGLPIIGLGRAVVFMTGVETPSTRPTNSADLPLGLVLTFTASVLLVARVADGAITGEDP